MGDFNLHIDWSTQVERGGLEEVFLECCCDSSFEQYVQNLRGSKLSWIWSCVMTGKINDLIVRDPLGLSDHNMVEFLIQMEGEKVESQTSGLCLDKGFTIG